MENAESIRAGQVVKFKRYEWNKRFAGMIVDEVENVAGSVYLIGRPYHLGHGHATYGKVVLAVTSFTVIEPIGA